VEWAEGTDKVPRPEFAAYLSQAAECFDSVEMFPHFPKLPRTFYMHPEPRGTGGQAFLELVNRFKPRTLIDRELVKAFFLSLFWGGRPGARPGWLFTADDEADLRKGRGSGKSMLARIGAYLTGGIVEITANEDINALKTRLLSPSARTTRVVLLDNIKSLRFSWGELEGLMTADVISGHQMYHGEGQRPNGLTWCLTVNGASMSRDMAERIVPVMLERPKYSAAWEDETRQLIEAKRWEIVGDILERFADPAATLDRYTRWSAWEAEVLARVAGASGCQRVIADRQGDIDDESNESELVRDAFVATIRSQGFNPDTGVFFFTNKLAAWVVGEATEKIPTNKLKAYMKNIAVPELRKSASDGDKGWRWTGGKSPPGLKATRMDTGQTERQ
jgi:hypothetical protein